MKCYLVTNIVPDNVMEKLCFQGLAASEGHKQIRVILLFIDIKTEQEKLIIVVI